jgi:GT2 family glycosyltransferase
MERPQAKNLSIASVTVAYNSAQRLPRQMDALLRQTQSLDEIIVVNNCSTDETLELLSAEYPQVTVLNLPSNVGVGGGLSAGLEYAAARKAHDWVWLLDDDSIPKESGLEKLLSGLSNLNGLAEGVGILAPVSVHSGTGLSYSGQLWRSGWTASPCGVSQESVTFVDAVISSGSLIRSEALARVGLPRADFFMDFVDYEHCLRFRRHGYKIVVVRDSLLDHTIGTPRTATFLGYSRPWSDHVPWREYYMSRNETFTIWDSYPDWRSKLSVIRRLVRHATGIIAFGMNKRACLEMMYLGFLDGRAGRLGIRFPNDSKRPERETA